MGVSVTCKVSTLSLTGCNDTEIMTQHFSRVETFSVNFNKADGGDAIKYAAHSFTFPPLRGQLGLYLAALARLVWP